MVLSVIGSYSRTIRRSHLAQAAMMVGLLVAASAACGHLDGLVTSLSCDEERAHLVAMGADVKRIVSAVKRARDCLRDELELAEPDQVASQGATQSHLARLRRQVRYQKERRVSAEDLLASDDRVGKRLQLIWFARAGLSNPATPVQRMEEFMAEFSRVEEKQISHTYVARVRDCFAELIKHLNRQCLANLVKETRAKSPNCSSHVVIGHIHDEASMRVRSFLPGALASARNPLRLCRSRSSKVQNNVVTVSGGGSSLEWFCELQPLARKDAPTIATAIILCISEIIDSVSVTASSEVGTGAVAVTTSSEAGKARLVHCVTGDAVNTNESALRRVLYYFRQAEYSTVEYFLLGWKCSSHQANLVVAAAICGEQGVRQPERNNRLCKACSQLFRHLMVDYCEEFGSSLRQHVIDKLRLRVASENDPSFAEERGRLRALYGAGVLPVEIDQVLNGKLGKLEVFTAEGTGRGEVCGQVYAMLYRLLLKVEEKPIVTRFFLFGECVFTLLRMKLLGVPDSVFQVGTKQPRKENKKRLVAFKAWYNDPESDKELRRASLCLCLTLHATSITAQKRDGVPMLVRLGRGEVQEKTAQQLSRMLPALGADPRLDIPEVVAALFATECHILHRFEMYNQFPTKLWTLCRAFNRDGFVSAIEAFLETPAGELDCGYSVFLQREATRKASGGGALEYMVSDGVQSELESLLTTASATSLDVERKHNQDKRCEQRRLSGVARASRSSILARYRLQRREGIASDRSNRKEAQKMCTMNVRALAIKKNPWLFGRACGRAFGSCADANPRGIVHQGDEDALKAYIEKHREELQAEATAIRQAGKDILAG